jgi:hypothetical protein
MEIIQQLFGALSEYIYVEYFVAVILLTEMCKRYVPPQRIHVKWMALVIAGVLAPVEYFVTQMTGAPIQWWKLIISFSLAVISYDYVWKSIKDYLAKRSPFKEKEKAPS